MLTRARAWSKGVFYQFPAGDEGRCNHAHTKQETDAQPGNTVVTDSEYTEFGFELAYRPRQVLGAGHVFVHGRH